MPTTVYLGNTAPVAVHRYEKLEFALLQGATEAEVKALQKQVDAGARVVDYRRKLDVGRTETRIVIPHSELRRALAEIDDALRGGTDGRGYHMDEPPAWVVADGDMADAITQHIVGSYSTEDHDVQIGRPDDWDQPAPTRVAPADEEDES